MTTEEEANGSGPAAEAAPAAGAEGAPVKKKSSVKVVKRVKSKKSEKGERPELAPPPATISEAPVQQQQVVEEPLPARPVERRVSSKKRAQRSGSNVFAMFTQNQVHQFKEAFSFIDQDKDGIISKADIRASFDALGRLCSDRELDEMTSEAPGPINFTMFLSVFGDRVQGTDEEEVVLQAFNRYDEGDGFCKEEKLRHALMTWGEKFTKQECDIILQEAPVDSRGRIDIRRFATLVTRGAEDEEEA